MSTCSTVNDAASSAGNRAVSTRTENKRTLDTEAAPLAPVLGVAQLNVAVLRKLEPPLHSIAEWQSQPNNLYVGRAVHYVGVAASKWANLFTIAKCGSRDRVVERYEQHVRQGPLWHCLHELAGQRLGCWCHTRASSATAKVMFCHADVLLKLFNERYALCPPVNATQ